ncbi:MAG: hypothetical protein SGJ10_14660 [Bacteroidota bacterium]|nr:hypothetical protein [Bacteroidota bacterium]
MDTGIVKDWLEEDSSFIIDSKSYRTYNETYENWAPNGNNRVDGTKSIHDSITYNPVNIMSADEASGIAMGVVFLIKFVDNVYVKPTPQDQGFYIKDEGKAILKRIIDMVSSTKNVDSCTLLGVTLARTHFNWAFENPAPNAPASDDIIKAFSTRVPTGGSFWWGNATGFSKVCNKYLGTTYGDSIVAKNCVTQIEFAAAGILLSTAASVLSPLAGAVVSNILFYGQNALAVAKYNMSTVAWDFQKSWPSQSSNFGLVAAQWNEIVKTNLSFATAHKIRETPIIDTIASRAIYTYCVNMGVLADDFDNSAIHYYSEILGCKQAELMNAVLNGHALTYRTKAFYDSLLNDAPQYFNPGTIGLDSVVPNSGGLHPRYFNSRYWQGPIAWHHHYTDIVSSPEEIWGENNGLDYMLLYNMYHLYFDSTASYAELPCDCYKYATDSINNIERIIYDNKVLRRIHPDYKQKGIKDPRYISMNTTIADNASLTTYSDLYLCNRAGNSPTWLNCIGTVPYRYHEKG